MKDTHGGNQALYKELLGNDVEFLDFSSNVNPLGIPKKINPILKNIENYLNKYPDINYTSLRKSIANYTSISFENIIVGNGATELIHHSIKALQPKKALNIRPAYSEYEVELKKINCKILDYFLKEESNFNIEEDIYQYIDKVDMIIICNPNNPTGSIYKRNELLKLLSKCLEYNTSVIIDETYNEFSREQSALSLVNEYKNLYVIRGTSKFFALSGLRLGYLITSNENTLNLIKKNQLPWTVNTIAEAVGEVVFTDKNFIEDSIVNTENEIHFFKNVIDSIDSLKVFNTYSNLFLVKILSEKTATDFSKFCLEKNVVIRDLTYYGFEKNGEKFFRISPLNRKENEVLAKLLKDFFK